MDSIAYPLPPRDGLTGVAAAGEAGAHCVPDPGAKELLRTGAEYPLIHALAVFACFGLWKAGAGAAGVAAWLFLAGALLFSGSLYVMALTSQRWVGPVTPIGGLLFMLGWGTLAWTAWPAGTKHCEGRVIAMAGHTARRILDLARRWLHQVAAASEASRARLSGQCRDTGLDQSALSEVRSSAMERSSAPLAPAVASPARRSLYPDIEPYASGSLLARPHGNLL